MDRLNIRLFGEPSLDFESKPLRLPRPSRCLSLLALLVLHRQPVARATLAAQLWPDELDADARANLRRHLHILQQALPKADGIEWISVDPRTLAWNDASPSWIDVRTFEESLADADGRVTAIALYRGDLLQGSFDDCLLAERERLRNAYIDACFETALSSRRAINFRDAIAYTDRILAMDEWREDAVRLAMRIRYESGDRSSALAQYEAFAKRLAVEMGVSPMAETVALRDIILAAGSLPALDRSANSERPIVDATMPFVGRNDELARLDAAWRHAAAGRGNTVFAIGEPGIGKSRLVGEFAVSAGAEGGRVLFGETSDPASYPYEPLVDALRRGLAFVIESPPPDAWLRVLMEILPELRAAFPDLSPADSLDPQKSRARLFEAIARTIEQLARARPLLIVLEDVHWAGAATVEALEAIACRIGAVPVLLVVTYRTTEAGAGHPVAALRQRLQKERRASAITLTRLPVADIEALVRKTGREPERAPELAEAVFACSEGNPLFAGLLLREFAETGTLPSPTRSPDAIARAVLSRLAPLSENARTLVAAAAILGRSFSSDILAEMLGWDEGDILETLGASIDRGLLRAAVSSAFTYTFTHALIEAAIYQSVPAADRVVRHRRAAEVLAPVAEGDRSVLASVARHWQLGERPDRAARSYLAAARAALAVYARDEAMALGRRALELSRDARERFDAATTIAEAAEHSPGDESWKSAIDLLRELASSLGAEEQFAAAMVAARHYSKRGDRTAQRAEIDRLLGLSTTLAPNLRANALYYSAMFDFQQGRLAEALTQLSDALELPENDPNTESLVRALLVQVFMRLSRSEEAALHSAALGKLCADSAPAAITMRYVLSKQQIAMETGDAEGARRAGLEMADLAASLGDTYLEAHGRMSIAYGTLRYGSADETRKQLAIGRDLCERIGYAAGVSSLTSAMASCELQLGRAAAALASLDEAIPILERMNAQLALAVAYYTKSQALLLLEDGLAALEAAATCERYAKATGSRNLIAGALETLGIATFRFGDAAAGIEQLEQSVRIRREIGPPARTIESLCALLEALLEAKRDEGVPALAAELEELYDRHADRAWKPTFVLSLLSRAAALRGDDAAAEAYRKRGRAILESDIARLADGEVAAALRSLPYNRLYA